MLRLAGGIKEARKLQILRLSVVCSEGDSSLRVLSSFTGNPETHSLCGIEVSAHLFTLYSLLLTLQAEGDTLEKTQVGQEEPELTKTLNPSVSLPLNPTGYRSLATRLPPQLCFLPRTLAFFPFCTGSSASTHRRVGSLMRISSVFLNCIT